MLLAREIAKCASRTQQEAGNYPSPPPPPLRSGHRVAIEHQLTTIRETATETTLESPSETAESPPETAVESLMETATETVSESP